ncbi:sugar ABC transporter ATP-binding protein [Jonesiaceae bacterium BS-20]|uniref:Sugar ABC transporter ATP-binding protein n=1 Tax=Jonesiaceae bacterium BS-20 TaxID=3120821 RepID=A0AAU7DUT2_9MICO
MTLPAVAPLVELQDITVSFPGTVALDRVNLKLYPGEVHALMGQNGAGKSTIVKVLNGVLQPDSGTIVIDGKEHIFRSPAESLAAGVAVVFQDINLSPSLSVAENVMLGRETSTRLGLGIDIKATRAAAAAQLAELGLDDLNLKTKLSKLSPPVKQLVAIARAMVAKPRVLLLDEPTSSLEVADVKRLFTVIRKLKERGVAIVFISHFLEQVYAISDRMTVLRDGTKVGEYPTRNLDRTELIALMLGKDLEDLQALGSERRAHHHEPDGPMLFEAHELGLTGEVEPTDFAIHSGEIVGFAGLRGSGRTELAMLLSGTLRSDSGTVTITGETLKLTGPGSGLPHRIAMSSENRTEEGIIGDFSIADNIMLALQALRGWNKPISKQERQETVDWYIDLLNLAPATGETLVRDLSGGSQQKVLLARWLATKPKFMILDEPTKGIDIGAKFQIQKHVAQLADQGMAVVFISSELEEVVRLADRIVVIKDREKIGELSNGPGVTVDTIVEMIAAVNEDGF